MSVELEKMKALVLLKELMSNDISEERLDEVAYELKCLVPDPSFLDYIFHSDDFIDENGDLDMERVIEKGFNYKPNVIAL